VEKSPVLGERALFGSATAPKEMQPFTLDAAEQTQNEYAQNKKMKNT